MGSVSDITTVAPSSRSHAPTSSGLRTMATTRSRRSLHNWMITWPVVLLAAFRTTQSPGCNQYKNTNVKPGCLELQQGTNGVVVRQHCMVATNCGVSFQQLPCANF